MFIDCPNIQIAHYQTIDEVLPYKQYKAGTKDKDKPVYQNPLESSSNPVLTLEFDILNKDGFGLKRGYYEIATNPEFTFLMFVQQGKIKAKIPVIKHELINEYGSDFEWGDDTDKETPNNASKDLTTGIMVSSKKIMTKIYSEKELKRRQKKYKKGMDPSLYFHAKTYIEYDKELNLYKVVWEKYNTRLTAVMKIPEDYGY
ncbi:TPA: hypothetical protein IAA82_03085 [Candidatus Galligastranaerophilus gallistercoris]|nr:hypothetical protein [Candidatus Galligastranaerophilus gallistercoris]